MRKIYIVGLIGLASLLIGLAWAQEQFTITTYYPAPYGVYRNFAVRDVELQYARPKFGNEDYRSLVTMDKSSKGDHHVVERARLTENNSNGGIALDIGVKDDWWPGFYFFKGYTDANTEGTEGTYDNTFWLRRDGRAYFADRVGIGTDEPKQALHIHQVGDEMYESQIRLSYLPPQNMGEKTGGVLINAKIHEENWPGYLGILSSSDLDASNYGNEEESHISFRVGSHDNSWFDWQKGWTNNNVRLMLLDAEGNLGLGISLGAAFDPKITDYTDGSLQVNDADGSGCIYIKGAKEFGGAYAVDPYNISNSLVFSDRVGGLGHDYFAIFSQKNTGGGSFLGRSGLSHVTDCLVFSLMNHTQETHPDGFVFGAADARDPNNSQFITALKIEAGTRNVGIGSANFHPSARGVLSLGVGSAPGDSATDSVQLYAKGNSAQLFVMDESGTEYLLDPHDPETGEWVFYSKNIKTGRVVRVEMEKLVKAVEELSGKKFMQESWETVPNPIGKVSPK